MINTVECVDGDKLEDEVSMDSVEEAERAEEKKIAKAFGEVGVGRDCLFISKTEIGLLMEAMGTAYCEEACRRTIKKLEVDGKIS